MNAPTKTAVRKPAARKTAAKPSPSMTLQAAMRSKDTDAVASIMLAQLEEANDLAASLSAVISAQARQLQSFRGLASLAIGQGPR